MIFASVAVHSADADDALSVIQAERPLANAHCAALGAGFFPVAGSDACIRISGRISAGVGFGASSGSAGSFGPRAAGAAANSFNAESAASGDLRFDTPAGPARVYVGVSTDANPRWVIDNQ